MHKKDRARTIFKKNIICDFYVYQYIRMNLILTSIDLIILIRLDRQMI